jgi:hypothetical protein
MRQAVRLIEPRKTAFRRVGSWASPGWYLLGSEAFKRA